MNKNRIQKLIALITVFCITTGAFAQLSQLGTLMTGGTKDATLILQEYLKPFGNSLGANLSAGWYNTAKVHKLLGVDLTFSLSIGLVPSGDKTFDPTKILAGTALPANVSRVITPANGLAPTIAGKNSSGPSLGYYYTVGANTFPIASYSTPKGLGVGFIPSPMLQLSIGLIKETSLSFRYVPTTKIGNVGQIGLWGIGIQHGLKQWIPVVSRVPFVNLTFQAGYTKLSNSENISFTPSDLTGVTDQTAAAVSWKGQKMDLTVSNFTANIIASVDIPVITVYGGVGLSSSKTDLGLLGNYPIPTFDPVQGKSVVTAASVVKDPIKVHIGSNDGNLTKPRLSAGLMLKLGPIHIHGDYTYAYYSIVSAGLGISIR
jgi:hypothetical protein